MIRACFHKFIDGIDYPQHPPFDPPSIFPELIQLFGNNHQCDASNNAYAGVRNLFIQLGLDKPNIGSPTWNPLRDFALEGKQVLIKPNLVTHYFPKEAGSVFATICHPALIRAVIDYALLAVGPSGKVIIGDTPIENCDFQKLCSESGLQELIETLHNRGVDNIELIDFRTYYTKAYPDSSVECSTLPGDPLGYTDIDLGRHSFFQELEDKSGGQNYYTLGDHTVDHLDPHSRKKGMPNKYHSSGRHIYRIPNTVLQSDFVINMAKLKTHKFSGVTLCLKNAIGICQGKEYLPHRRPGSPEDGGDSFQQYPSAKYVWKLKLRRLFFSLLGGRRSERFLKAYRSFVAGKQAHEVYSEPLFGDWWGNDTIWRTTLDLNNILLHGTPGGFNPDSKGRPFLGIVDGIIGMDHEAPMTGLPVYSNLLIAGTDPVSVDSLGTILMGFDPDNIPTISNAKTFLLSTVGKSRLDTEDIMGNISLKDAQCSFVATKGWQSMLNVRPNFEEVHSL